MSENQHLSVTPAQAGVQAATEILEPWIPAFAGMTNKWSKPENSFRVTYQSPSGQCRGDPHSERTFMFSHHHGRGERRHARGGFTIGGRFGGHHHGSGRGGRLGRVFEHGDLRYVLLHLVAEKPRYGYELIKTIEEQFGGMYSPSPGVVYPTLTLLEELGQVSAESGGGTKRLYRVTEEGAKFLEANHTEVDRILNRIAETSRAFGGGPAPEIRRAVGNLEMALSIRLGKGPLDAGQVQAITQALDRAAAEIERI
jgi:DNA-binding PadR family transcriptional regulator